MLLSGTGADAPATCLPGPAATASLLLPALLLSSCCPGRIGKIRLLGDLQHSTRIAFIEFVDAEAAMAALNCSGALLGELPLLLLPARLRADWRKCAAGPGAGWQQLVCADSAAAACACWAGLPQA